MLKIGNRPIEIRHHRSFYNTKFILTENKKPRKMGFQTSEQMAAGCYETNTILSCSRIFYSSFYLFHFILCCQSISSCSYSLSRPSIRSIEQMHLECAPLLGRQSEKELKEMKKTDIWKSSQLCWKISSIYFFISSHWNRLHRVVVCHLLIMGHDCSWFESSTQARKKS